MLCSGCINLNIILFRLAAIIRDINIQKNDTINQSFHHSIHVSVASFHVPVHSHSLCLALCDTALNE